MRDVKITSVVMTIDDDDDDDDDNSLVEEDDPAVVGDVFVHDGPENVIKPIVILHCAIASTGMTLHYNVTATVVVIHHQPSLSNR